MAGILDFLGALGQVAAPAARGYSAGKVAAEQYQQRLKAALADQNVKQQQVDIAKRHQQFIEDQAAAAPLDEAKKSLRDTGFKLMMSIHTDPKAQEALQQQGPHAVQDAIDFANEV